MSSASGIPSAELGLGVLDSRDAQGLGGTQAWESLQEGCRPGWPIRDGITCAEPWLPRDQPRTWVRSGDSELGQKGSGRWDPMEMVLE